MVARAHLYSADPARPGRRRHRNGPSTLYSRDPVRCILGNAEAAQLRATYRQHHLNRRNVMLNRLRHTYHEKRAHFEAGYRKFARMRGFKTFNDFEYHRRGFIECWAEPGFHRFWQVWNPGIAYFVYRIYVRLGGSKKWTMPTLFSFIICGIIHTLIVAPFMRQWSFSVIVAFTCFGVLTILSRKLSYFLKQERWPWIMNALINVGFVIGSFDIGFRVDRLLS